MKKLYLALSLLTVFASSQGCVSQGFATRSDDDSLTFITFADELPAALNEIFDTCVTPLELTPGATELDLLGECDSASDLSSATARTMYTLFNASRTIDVDIPEIINDCDAAEEECEPTTFGVDFNNCEVTLDSTVVFHGLSFATIDTSWSSYPGQPSLKIRLGNTAYPSSSPYYFRPISVWNDVSIECDSGLVTALARLWLNNRLKKWGIEYFEVGYSDIDVDLYFKMSSGGSGLNVQTAVYADLDGFELHYVDMDTWPDYLLQEFEGMEEDIEEQLEDLLRSQVSGLKSTIASSMETAIPSGHDVCDLDIAGGAFVMTTDDASGDVPQCIAASEYRPDYGVTILDAELVSSFKPLVGLPSYTYDVSCVVWNAGIAPAEDISVLRLEDNTFRAVKVQVDPLDAGVTSTHVLRITSSKGIGGGLLLTAIADYVGDLDELDETNNTDEEDFLIDPIDTTLPEWLGLDRLIEHICPLFEEPMVEELFDAIIMATDQCIMCDPWAVDGGLILNETITTYFESAPFQNLVTLRAMGTLTEQAFQERVSWQLVQAMSAKY